MNHEEINFCVMNVNSMHSVKKEKLVRLGIADSRADVIVLTETKLGEGSNEFKAPGYKIIAQKDHNRGAGGIMILAKTKLKICEADAVDIVKEMLPNCWFNSFFLFVLMFVKCHPLLVEGNPYDSPKYSRDSIK